MNDLEDLLRRYRPAGPPAGLRGAVTGAVRKSPRSTLLEWMPAAAALVLAVLFSWLASNERRIADSQFTPVPPIEQAITVGRVLSDPAPLEETPR